MEISPTKCRNAPLLGKKIYIHYDAGTRPQKTLECVLQLLKAEIVQFLDRNVDFVITNVPGDRIPPPSLVYQKSKENVDPSSLATSEQPCSEVKTLPPTLTAESQVKCVTRGRAMLLAATTKPIQSTISPNPNPVTSDSKRSSDLLVRVRNLGIKILTIEAVNKWIKNLPEVIKQQLEIGESPFDYNDSASPNHPELDRICCVRSLINPCIKILDLNGRTRPNFVEKSNYMASLWRSVTNQLNRVQDTFPCDRSSLSHPQPPNVSEVTTTPHASVGCTQSTNLVTGCTSQPTKRLKKTGGGADNSKRCQVSCLRKQNLVHDTAEDRQQLSSHSMKKRDHIVEPPGYCECCSISYTNLYEHVYGMAHRQYAENAENFCHIDQFISELPSMEQFLRNLRSKPISAIPPPPELTPLNRTCQRASACGSSHLPNGQCQRAKDKKKNTNEENTSGMAAFHLIPPPPRLSIHYGYTNRSKEVEPLFSDPVNEGHVTPHKVTGAAGVTVSVPTVSCAPLAANTDFPMRPPCELSNLSRISPVLSEELDPILSPPIAFADDAGFEASEPIVTCIPNVISTNDNLRESEKMESAQRWRQIMDSLSIKSPSKKGEPPASVTISPVLEKVHRSCADCGRVHIPAKLPILLEMQLSVLFGAQATCDGFGCNPQSSIPLLQGDATYESDKSELSSQSNRAPKDKVTQTEFIEGIHGIPDAHNLRKSTPEFVDSIQTPVRRLSPTFDLTDASINCAILPNNVPTSSSSKAPCTPKTDSCPGKSKLVSTSRSSCLSEGGLVENSRNLNKHHRTWSDTVKYSCVSDEEIAALVLPNRRTILDFEFNQNPLELLTDSDSEKPKSFCMKSLLLCNLNDKVISPTLPVTAKSNPRSPSHTLTTSNLKTPSPPSNSDALTRRNGDLVQDAPPRSSTSLPLPLRCSSSQSPSGSEGSDSSSDSEDRRTSCSSSSRISLLQGGSPIPQSKHRSFGPAPLQPEVLTTDSNSPLLVSEGETDAGQFYSPEKGGLLLPVTNRRFLRSVVPNSTRSTRRASSVARQSISLSIQALFTPTKLDSGKISLITSEDEKPQCLSDWSVNSTSSTGVGKIILRRNKSKNTNLEPPGIISSTLSTEGSHQFLPSAPLVHYRENNKRKKRRSRVIILDSDSASTTPTNKEKGDWECLQQYPSHYTADVPAYSKSYAEKPKGRVFRAEKVSEIPTPQKRQRSPPPHFHSSNRSTKKLRKPPETSLS